jgi:hypothetical protein
MRVTVAKALGLILFAVIVPVPLVSALGFGSAGSFIGLAGVGSVIAVLTVGVRVGLLVMVAGGVAASALALASVTWWSAAIVMSLVALAFGLTARKGWQGGLVTVIIALSFIASDAATVVEPLGRAATVLGVGFAVWGAIVAGVTSLFFRTPIFPTKPESPRTVLGYVSMLVIVTFITQSLAIILNLGHVGGWFVMTPFVVILPHIHDGFHKSLRRAAGTIGGFLIVMVVAGVTTSHIVFFAVGAIAFTSALYAKLKSWNYFFFALFLTPGIVILEGLSSSVTQLAEYRVEATLGAIALSLAVMGTTTIIGRKTSRRAPDQDSPGSQVLASSGDS